MTSPWASTIARTCVGMSAVRHDPATPARKKEGGSGLLLGESGQRFLCLQAVERDIFDGAVELRLVQPPPSEESECR